MKHAREFLESTLALYLDEGMTLPERVDLDTLEAPDGFVTLIQADPTPFIKNNKAIRKNVTVPEWLTKLADREGINYSEVLAKALQSQLNLQITQKQLAIFSSKLLLCYFRLLKPTLSRIRTSPEIILK